MIRVAGVAALVVLSAGCVPSQEPRPRSGEAEASANFDGDDIMPVLSRVSRAVTSGFDSLDVRRVTGDILGQGEQTYRTFRFRVVYKGQVTPVRLVAWKDDPDASDLWFFTSRPLADTITAMILQHMDSVGK